MKGEWISVKDRLPINSPREMKSNYEVVNVITFDGDNVESMEFRAGKTIHFWREWQDDWPVTHWMPLPEPPQ